MTDALWVTMNAALTGAMLFYSDQLIMHSGTRLGRYIGVVFIVILAWLWWLWWGML